MLCVHIASAQTVLNNGANEAGTLVANTTNSYTFTANAGDYINLRLGTTGFNGRLQLVGPDSSLLGTAQNSTDDLISLAAASSGTYTVLVSSYFAGGNGSYVLHLAQVPEAFIVPNGDEGGPMTNGGNYAGTITLGDLDLWTFTANIGDSVSLRLGSTSFNGKLELYAPNGALLGTAQNSTDNLISLTAASSGTFTVLVSSYNPTLTGTYVLHLAQVPEAFIVPSGDEGGALTNGGNFAGTITLGDLDLWTFTANPGDNINLRLGTTGFNGKLQLYAPDGSLLDTAQNSTDDLITYTATSGGTFTVLVSSYNPTLTGTYVLHLAQVPEGFIVPSGDDGGAMANGGNYSGTITLGDLDLWTFTANGGDSIILRLGTTGFNGKLQLYGPNGALLSTAQNSPDDLITYTASSSGTFTVLVSSYNPTATGTYVLHLAQVPEAFMVPSGDEGGALTNGGNFAGTITLGDLDLWTFTANAGDSINLRLGTTSFNGNLELYGPNGALLGTAQNSTDTLITYTATSGGTFTVLVSSYNPTATGSYVLHLAQVPEAFIIPSGDDGGPMSNGGNFAGTISLGDLDLWTFSAKAGDTINLRLGTTSFNGKLELYGPNGALLSTTENSTDDLISYTAASSGTFTVLVSSYNPTATGTYVLHLAQFPEAFTVPPGDQGGTLTGSASYLGTINLGDLDTWAFTACQGDLINLRLNTTNFNGKLELYGSNGALLKVAQNSTVLNLAYLATNCGPFAVLVSSFNIGATGTYALAANGLTEGLKLCRPVIKGSTLTLNGVGGDTGATFVLYSTTDVAKSFGLWTPVLTNHFDQLGVLTYTNVYDPGLQQEYFRCLEP